MSPLEQSALTSVLLSGRRPGGVVGPDGERDEEAESMIRMLAELAPHETKARDRLIQGLADFFQVDVVSHG